MSSERAWQGIGTSPALTSVIWLAPQSAPTRIDETPAAAGEWTWSTKSGAPSPREIFRAQQSGSPSPKARDARVIIFMHGGAFALLTPSGAPRDLTYRLANESRAMVFSVNYRRAPEHCYPAAVDDVFQAFCCLAQYVDPSRIVLMGDSAGGNLVVHALARIRDRGMKTAAGGVLMSPWLNPLDVNDSPSWQSNGFDYVSDRIAATFGTMYSVGQPSGATGQLHHQPTADIRLNNETWHVNVHAC